MHSPLDDEQIMSIADVVATDIGSRSTVYKAIAAGDLKVFKVGRSTKTTRGSYRAWVRLLQERSQPKRAA